jgi:type II secretory pathway pseudopilin PulG
MEIMKNKGFTLVELLIVITIMIILAIIAVGAINPIAQTNKSADTKAKRDIGRIKIAMEDYYNDKGCYPTQSTIDILNNKTNCNSDKFVPWLTTWPCDSQGEPYKLAVETLPVTGDPILCPKWFKVFANLLNKKDGDIPENWAMALRYVGSLNPRSTFSSEQVNYGASSTNIRWDERMMFNCGAPACNVRDGGGWNGVDVCEAGFPNCSWGTANQGAPQCLVGCCRQGVVCD